MGGKVDTSKDQWWQKHNASNMVEVHSMDEFLGELKRCGEGKLVIVDFYARWCAACRALHPKLCKIAEANAADVVVIKIEFDDNKDLCRGMGVKVLPYFQLYKGSLGKVAGFSASISKVGRIREAIEEHRPGGAYDRDEDVGMGWPVDVDASKSGSEDEEPAGDREPAPAR
jgi:thiol-disulfide isomerase/thioredoxin